MKSFEIELHVHCVEVFDPKTWEMFEFPSLAEAFTWIEARSPLAEFERYAAQLDGERVTAVELAKRNQARGLVAESLAPSLADAWVRLAPRVRGKNGAWL